MADIDGTPIYVGGDLANAGTWLNTQAGTCADDLQTLKSQLAPLQEAWTQSQAAGYYQGLQQESNAR